MKNAISIETANYEHENGPLRNHSGHVFSFQISENIVNIRGTYGYAQRRALEIAKNINIADPTAAVSVITLLPTHVNPIEL